MRELDCRVLAVGLVVLVYGALFAVSLAQMRPYRVTPQDRARAEELGRCRGQNLLALQAAQRAARAELEGALFPDLDPARAGEAPDCTYEIRSSAEVAGVSREWTATVRPVGMHSWEVLRLAGLD